MKKSEYKVVSVYLNEWTKRNEQEIFICEKWIESVREKYNNNQATNNINLKIDGNLEVIQESSRILYKISELAKEKLIIINLQQVIQELEKQEADETDIPFSFDDISPYVYEKTLNQLILILEKFEMYEACSMIINHIENKMIYHRAA